MTASPPKSTAQFVQAAAWMGGVLIAFSAMAVAGRELSDTMNTFEIVFFRALVALLIILVFVFRQGWATLRTPRLSIHILRNVFHFGGQFGWFLGISLLPLATVFAIEFTIPIWAAMLAVIFLGERMNQGRVIALIAGIVGVVIILRPGAEIIELGSLVVLGASFCYAVAYITTKKVSAFDSPLVVVFYMNLIHLPLGLIPALFDWTMPVTADLPWIFLVGVTGLLSHYCLTRAFALADATLMIPIDFLRLPLIAVVGFLFYSEAIEIALFVGAIIIFAGNYYNIRLETKKDV